MGVCILNVGGGECMCVCMCDVCICGGCACVWLCVNVCSHPKEHKEARGRLGDLGEALAGP